MNHILVPLIVLLFVVEEVMNLTFTFLFNLLICTVLAQNYCGKSRIDAKKCEIACPNGAAGCPSDEFCYVSVSCNRQFSRPSVRKPDQPVAVHKVSPGDAAQLIGTIDQALENTIKRVGDIIVAFKDKDRYRSKSDQYMFYEGNFCSEEIVGSFYPNAGRRKEAVNVKKVSFFKNDEARSVAIKGPVYRGEKLTVCDHPKKCSKDDYAVITFIRDLPKGWAYCVSTFERTYADPLVSVYYRRKNGLDGKVSRVRNY